MDIDQQKNEKYPLAADYPHFFSQIAVPFEKRHPFGPFKLLHVSCRQNYQRQ